MKKNRMNPWLTGILFAVALVAGILFLFLPKPAAVVLGIVLFCVCLALALIKKAPGFYLGVAGGVLMVFLPPWTAGIFLIIYGIGGMIGTAVTSGKRRKK